MKRDLLTLDDLRREELERLLGLARYHKEKARRGERVKTLEGKTLGLIFFKASTRTRVSFEVGMIQLGGSSLYLGANDLQLGRGETLGDSARVLSRYLDGIVIRTFDHAEAEDLASYSSIPVINGLTDKFHPCQALSDIFTIGELFGSWQGVKVAFVGDGNNVAHSLMLGCAKLGLSLAVATPEGYEPKPDVVRRARELALEGGGELLLSNEPAGAVAGAGVVYTDVWASMGQEAEQEERRRRFRAFQVNESLMSLAAPGARFMHCLPAHRGEEVTDEVIEGKRSAVWEQAENRLHVQKAILEMLLGES